MYLIFILILILCVALDQFTKAKATFYLDVGNSQVFIPNFLDFTLAKNTGLAFSLGHGHIVLMTAISLGATFYLIYMFIKHKPVKFILLFYVSFALLLGGALSNILDRICRGYVIDFIEFSQFNFPVFNLADVFIDSGIVLFLLYNYLSLKNP